MNSERSIDAKDGRALPGYLKKSFAMNFGGGEIWFEHLDGIYGFGSLVLEKLEGDIPAFSAPSKPSLIGVVLSQTEVTPEIVSAVSAALCSGKRFTRVAFIGLSHRAQKDFKRALAKGGFALAFFSDFEELKIWLVSENPM